MHNDYARKPRATRYTANPETVGECAPGDIVLIDGEERPVKVTNPEIALVRVGDAQTLRCVSPKLKARKLQ